MVNKRRLLGYFTVKPHVLNIRYSDMREDLQFIAGEFFSGMKLGRKNLSPMEKVRIYRAYVSSSVFSQS